MDLQDLLLPRFSGPFSNSCSKATRYVSTRNRVAVSLSTLSSRLDDSFLEFFCHVNMLTEVPNINTLPFSGVLDISRASSNLIRPSLPSRTFSDFLHASRTQAAYAARERQREQSDTVAPQHLSGPDDQHPRVRGRSKQTYQCELSRPASVLAPSPCRSLGENDDSPQNAIFP